MNQQAEAPKQIPFEEMTVNGVPVTSLSEAGQRLFKKIMALKEEADGLVKQHESKQAALKELTEMVLEEIKELQAAAEASTTTAN